MSATAERSRATGARNIRRRASTRGEPSEKVYALNFFVGHHGIFSLTPVWLLSLLGMGLWIFRRGDARVRWSTGAIFAISAVVVAFYLTLPPLHRNYGGSTSGLRWLFWLAPLWLLVMLPAADLLASRRWTRGLGVGLAGPLRPLGQLSDLEPLDASVADGLFAIHGVGIVTRRTTRLSSDSLRTTME